MKLQLLHRPFFRDVLWTALWLVAIATTILALGSDLPVIGSLPIEEVTYVI
jgi:hypothetical protein